MKNVKDEMDVANSTFSNCNKNEPVAFINDTEKPTIHIHLTLDNKVGDIVNHAAFRGFGEMLLPWNDNSS